MPTLETFTEFYEFFESQSDILCATIQKKQTFIDLIEKSPVLRIVQLSDDWAGLGGVYYGMLMIYKKFKKYFNCFLTFENFEFQKAVKILKFKKCVRIKISNVERFL